VAPRNFASFRRGSANAARFFANQTVTCYFNRVRPLVGLLAFAALCAAACERRATVARPPSAPSGEAARAAVAPVAPLPPPEVPSWVEALRGENYADAARLLDALGPEQQEEPKVRFARARTALELQDHARVLSSLEGLETTLPLLAPRVRALRAQATLEVGPFAEAARFFEEKGDVESLSRAALAYERAGEPERALALAARVVKTLSGKRQRSVEARARQVRARVFEQKKQPEHACTELRWLAIETPLSSGDADVRLEALSKTRALSREERLGRALAFAKEGDVTRTEAELEKLARAPGVAIPQARLDRTRAFALYHSRSDYQKASELFARAASGKGVDPVECAYYAARSLARGHDDARALEAYGSFLSRFARSTLAEQVSYRIAQIHYTSGQFAEAVKAYDRYLASYGKRGSMRDEAVYERGTSLLASGDNARAREAFAKLAGVTDDPRKAARYRHLEGVALAQSGDKAGAEAVFRRVLREQPLSFAALASFERLSHAGVTDAPLLAASTVSAAPPPLSLELPADVRLLSELGLDADAEDALRAWESAIADKHAARAGEALCTAYGTLATAARRYQLAQARVDARVLAFEPTEATRWQWDCVYPRPYPAVVNGLSEDFGLPHALLYGVMRQESGFRTAVMSGARAVGLMQIIEPTGEQIARELAEPFQMSMLTAPSKNLRFGAFYLRKLLDTFGGNVAVAAAAYNAGPLAVRRWLAGAKGLPLDVFVARIPYEETQTYVERVVANYARYRYVEAGSSAVPRIGLELPEVPEAEGLY
jgi:soluble lytic murein transglycosylase